METGLWYESDMTDFFNYLTAHPVAVLLMAAALLFFVYFLLRQLLRLALICGLVFVCLCGYYYVKGPSEFPAKAEESVKEVTDKTRGVFEQGRTALEKSKELTRKIAEKAKKDDR